MSARSKSTPAGHTKGDSSTARARSSVSSFPAWVLWEWDADADRILTSANLHDVYGVAALSRASQGFTVVHPDDIEAHQTVVHEAVERGRGYQSSFRIVRPDDRRTVWIEERAEAVDRGASYQPLLFGIAFDATLRHHARASAMRIELLDALEGFADVLLARYATALRRSRSRAKRVTSGEWIELASRELATLKPGRLPR
jgi:hypothetical protein